jgi:RecB family exonuclease
MLDPLTYGSLLHAVAERFYVAHGDDFVARKGTLSGWQKKAGVMAGEEFAAVLSTRPLVGRGVVEKERSRLLRDLDSFLAYDWRLPLTRFVGVELSFDGLAIDAGAGKLHVHGRIDRLDVEGDHALLRDLKSGNDHPRIGKEAGPTPNRDVQLGLYSLVARKMAREWKLPARLQAAYVYPRRSDERAFRDDHGELERATKEWLGVAHGLLSSRSFPPSPSGDDCKYCPFRVACDGQDRALAAAEECDGAVLDFFALKAGPGGESK